MEAERYGFVVYGSSLLLFAINSNSQRCFWHFHDSMHVMLDLFPSTSPQFPDHAHFPHVAPILGPTTITHQRGHLMDHPAPGRRRADRLSRLVAIRKWWANNLGYWTPMSHPHMGAFLDEQHRGSQRTIRLAMIIGAVVFCGHGIVDWFHGLTSPILWQEFALRLSVGTILAVLIFSLDKTYLPGRSQKLMSAYVGVLVLGLVGTVFLNPARTHYSLFPITFIYLMATALWFEARYMFATLIISSSAVSLLFISGAISPLDSQNYGFYIILAIIMGSVLRQDRMRTAFDAFLLRKQLARQAHTDPLTGILNRGGWSDYMASCQRGGNYMRPSSLLYFDLDKFKAVNDTYGHPVGDQLLQSTASHVKYLLRENDVLARFGGEEFVVFLPGVGHEVASVVAERIRQNIASQEKPVRVTLSVGVSELRANETIDQAVERADGALLLAKQQGRNRVVVLP
jgi:diguanylate cyclase (GGDEF)-like protein